MQAYPVVYVQIFLVSQESFHSRDLWGARSKAFRLDEQNEILHVTWIEFIRSFCRYQRFVETAKYVV